MKPESFLCELAALRPGVQTWITAFRCSPHDATGRDWRGRIHDPCKPLPLDGVNAYFSVGLFPLGTTKRNKQTALGMAAVLVDDATTKGDGNPLSVLGDPSAKIQTSPKSQQWVYFLDRLAVGEEADRLCAALTTHGLGDRSGNNFVRYGRLPGGVNTKPEYGEPFFVQLTKWQPTRRFSVDDLLKALGSQSRTHVRDEELEGLIISGRSLHEPLRTIGARMIGRGHSQTETLRHLQELMEQCRDKVETGRWQARWNSLPQQIADAARKFRPQVELPEDDVLAGISDPRIVELLRPHIDAGAVVTASDDVPYSVAARVAFRAMKATLFLQGGQPVEIIRSASEDTIQPVSERALASRVDRSRRVLRVHRNGSRFSVGPARLPTAQAGVLLAAREAREELREIHLVLRRPVIVEANGELVTLMPGYNDGTGIYVTGGQTIPDIPIHEAVDALTEILSGFAFAAPADRSRAIGALILPALMFGRFLFGHAPMILVEGDQSQAGKGLLTGLLATLYGERRQLITQKARGGVGSVDESFGAALLRGCPFICFDNFRGELDSAFLEAVITAGHDSVAVRVPYRGEVSIDTSQFVFLMTSNGVVLTPDQANRVLTIRIVKRPEGFTFARYSEGTLLAHIEKRQPYFAGCILAVVRRWFDAGKPRNPVPHTFEEMGALDWIVREVFGLAPLLEAHGEIVVRLADPEERFLRALALEIEKQERLGRWLLTSALVEIAREAGLAPYEGWRDGDGEDNKQLGRVLAKCFAKSDVRDLGHLRMRRVVGAYDYKQAKRYCVWRPADGPPPEHDSDDDF